MRSAKGEELANAGTVGGMFRALSHRNFRIFWAGAFLSNIGTWMQVVAQGWLVLQLTDSPFILGLDGFMATIPGLLLTLAGGVFADLIDRRLLLLYTQAGAMVSALLLGVLLATGVVHTASDIWIVLALSFWTGCCMSIASPSYQAITVDLVGREDLANAIALNSTQFQLSRVVGPALAGFAFRVFPNLSGCFFANGASYLAVLIALLKVRIPPPAAKVEQRSFWSDLIDGLRYVGGRPRVFMLLLISAMISFLGAPYATMIPLFARDVLHVGATGLSVMMGVVGAGAVCGALVLAFAGDFRDKGGSVLAGSFTFAVCMILFSQSTRPALSLVFLFGMGFSIVCAIAVINTLLQQLVIDDMRGRVMSMFILSFLGTMPFGSLLAGAAAHLYGAPLTLTAGGAILGLFTILVAVLRPDIRRQ